jgi:hypothetical protein
MMYVMLLLTLLFSRDPVPKKAATMTEAETKLFKEIMAYRKSKGLPEIKISPALNLVAQMHAEELVADGIEEPCNMHSWTGKFGEKACCYTDDHKEAACMWGKPKEFTSYSGTGFEIAAFSTYENPNWLENWKSSPGHHAVIINTGNWKSQNWQAIGVAIRPPYALVWFGREPDVQNGK